ITSQEGSSFAACAAKRCRSAAMTEAFTMATTPTPVVQYRVAVWLSVSSTPQALMATITIRGLDDELHARLRIRAARHGRSMEAEVRQILQEQLLAPRSIGGLGSRIHARFAALGGVDLDLPRREETPRSATFDARPSAPPTP